MDNNSQPSHIILIIAIIALLIYVNYNDIHHVINHSSNLKPNSPQNVQNTSNSMAQPLVQPLVQPIIRPMIQPPIDPMRDYDNRTINDPLIPPYKRDDYNIDPYLVNPHLFIHTRGLSTSFRKVGMLIDKNSSNDNKYKFFILMGRQKYRSSSQYEYYVVSDSKESIIKFELPNKKEIYTGDKIKIAELGDVEYEASIDKNLPYEYIPYI